MWRIGHGSVGCEEARTRRRAGGEHHQVDHVRTSAGDAPLHVRGQRKNATLKLVGPLIPDKYDPLTQASFSAPPAMSSAVPPPPPFPLGKFGLNSSPVRPHSLPISVPLHRGPPLHTPRLPPMLFRADHEFGPSPGASSAADEADSFPLERGVKAAKEREGYSCSVHCSSKAHHLASRESACWPLDRLVRAFERCA
jgi:hypothetical protein